MERAAVGRVQGGQCGGGGGFPEQKITHDPAALVLERQVAVVARPRPGVLQRGERVAEEAVALPVDAGVRPRRAVRRLAAALDANPGLRQQVADLLSRTDPPGVRYLHVQTTRGGIVTVTDFKIDLRRLEPSTLHFARPEQDR